MLLLGCLGLSLFHDGHAFVNLGGCLVNELLNLLTFLLQLPDLSDSDGVGHERLQSDAALEFQILEVVLAVLIDELRVQLAEEGFLWRPHFFLHFSVLVLLLNDFLAVHEGHLDDG